MTRPILSPGRRRAAHFVRAIALGAGVSLSGCALFDPSESPDAGEARDPHSYSRPDEVAVRHLDLDLSVDFSARRLRGSARLALDRHRGDELHLDSHGLTIESVELLPSGSHAEWRFGPADDLLGRALVVELAPATEAVRIHYETDPNARALQWLAPEQTAGKRAPFLFSQSQAILARTWIPCQDSPAVRMTYSARVRVAPELLAVMSASNPTEKNSNGVYAFEMKQPIPSYLLALAVGDLEFRSISERAGVYAEPSVVEKAAWEFADTERMIAEAERLYGPYRWDRYDILVLPPSFPFGGMENPRLTFATPTILAGDRSLVALVAHELAHSWSGNLVTNATWNEFWLNEGFTVYFEQRIMEAVFGREYSEMLATLELAGLRKEIEEIGREHADTHLHLALEGRDPDDGMTAIAYVKGYYFLRTLEALIGRERWDAFLRAYFEEFAFRSMTSAGFLAHLRAKLVGGDEALESKLALDDWVYGPGLPPNLDAPTSARLERVLRELERWQSGAAAVADLGTEGWSTHEWLHFIRHLPDETPADELARLDAAFRLTASGNSEILCAWLLRAISAWYEPALPTLERFLRSVGRRKFLQPLYERLAETERGREFARRVYAEARPGYHSIATGTLDAIIGTIAEP